MSTVTIPRADAAAVEMDDKGRLLPTRDLYRWMRDITERVGGVTGSSTTDLATAAFDDAGIEEGKAMTFAVADAAGQVPAAPDLLSLLVADNQRLSGEVEELRGVVNELWKFVQDARQGVLLS